MMKTKDWQTIKKEFESVPSYEQKLLWWKLNIPKLESKFSESSIQFQYSQEDAPEFELLAVCIAFQLSVPNVHNGTSIRKDFISILPEHNNSKDKQLFFNWVLKETKVDTLEIIEGKYLNDLQVVHIGNRDSILADYKTQLTTEYNNGLNNLWFKSGYDYARSNNSSVLNFGEPTTFYMDPEFMIKNTIKGYLNNLKELAIYNIENKPIEQLIEGIESKFKMQPIGLLYELGVIDFLKDESNLSPAKIAALLYSITNIKASTSEGYIKHVEGVKNDKNNPFNSEQNRNFYKQVFANIGIEPIKKGKPDEERER